jgi:hypothetical protein
MSNILMEHLDAALDDVHMSHEYADEINGCVQKVLSLRDEQKCAEQELVRCIDRLCADLATEIRALQPNLHVTIKTGCLEIGYRTRIICCVAKPYDGCWNYDGTDFGLYFSKKYPECRPLDCTITDLSRRLVDYFNNHYKSLV